MSVTSVKKFMILDRGSDLTSLREARSYYDVGHNSAKPVTLWMHTPKGVETRDAPPNLDGTSRSHGRFWPQLSLESRSHGRVQNGIGSIYHPPGTSPSVSRAIEATLAAKFPNVKWRNYSSIHEGELREAKWESMRFDAPETDKFFGGGNRRATAWIHHEGVVKIAKPGVGHETAWPKDHEDARWKGRVVGDEGFAYTTKHNRIAASSQVGRLKRDLERAFPKVKRWMFDQEVNEANMSEAKRLISELEENKDWRDQLPNSPSGGFHRTLMKRWKEITAGDAEHPVQRARLEKLRKSGAISPKMHKELKKRIGDDQDMDHAIRVGASEARERWEQGSEMERKRYGAIKNFRYVGPHGYHASLHVYKHEQTGQLLYVNAVTGEQHEDLGSAMRDVKGEAANFAHWKWKGHRMNEARELIADLFQESGFESSPFRPGTYQDTGTEIVYNAGHGRYYYSKSTGRVSYHKAMTAPRSSKTTRGSGVELGMAKNQEHAMRMIRNHQVPIEQRRASGLPDGPGQAKPYQRRLTGLESRDPDAPRHLWVAEEPNGRGSFVAGSTVAQVRATYAKMGYNPNDIHHIGDYRSPLWVNKKHPLAKYKPGSNSYDEKDDHMRESRDADSRSQGGAAKFLLNDEDWHSGSFQHPDEGPVRAVHRDGRYTIHASAAGYHVRHEETDHGHSGVWGKFHHKPEAVGSPQKSFEDAQLVARYHYLKNYAGNGGAYMGEAREIVEELTEDAGGFHVMTWGGGRYNSISWHKDEAAAHAEVRRLKSLGAWSGMPPKIEAGRHLGWAKPQEHEVQSDKDMDHAIRVGTSEARALIAELSEGISYEAGHTTKPGTPAHLISIGQQMEKDGSPVFNKGASTAERMIAEHAAITGEHRSTVAAKAEQLWGRVKAERERGVKSTDGHGSGWNKGAGTYNGNWNKRGT